MRLAWAAHDGYLVHVLATQSRVVLTVENRKEKGKPEDSTSYLARAKLSGNRLSADFGGLGRVAMRFDPSGTPPSRSCEDGQRRLTSRGVFIGSLRFRGEADYLGVDVRRVEGTMVDLPPGPRCRASQAPSEGRPVKPERKLSSLFAGFRQGLDATYFQAQTTDAGRVLYTVTDESGGERVAVYHHARVEASPLTFATNDALTFASVSPPYPFSGTGLVARNADGSRSWTGSLAVSFPGDARVELTGPEFKTQLTRQW